MSPPKESYSQADTPRPDGPLERLEKSAEGAKGTKVPNLSGKRTEGGKHADRCCLRAFRRRSEIESGFFIWPDKPRSEIRRCPFPPHPRPSQDRRERSQGPAPAFRLVSSRAADSNPRRSPTDSAAPGNANERNESHVRFRPARILGPNRT